MPVILDSQQQSEQTEAPARATWSRAGLAYWLPFVAFYALAANLPFWVASRWMGIFQNGWLCLDYVAVGLAALLLPRIVSAGLLVAAIGIDVLAGLCQTYFLSPRECLANLSVVRHFSGTRLLTLAAVVLLALTTAALAAMLPVRTIRRHFRRPAAICLLVFAILCLGVDGATVLRRTGSISNFLHRRTRESDAITSNYFTEFRLSRVPTTRLIHIQNGFAHINAKVRAHERTGVPIPSAAGDAIERAGLSKGREPGELPNLVVIVVESWGLDADASIRNGLLEPYLQPALQARYELVQGVAPHYGNTVAGEARELCGNSMGFHILVASAKELEGCIPDQLAGLGYRSMALHGMEGNLFNRSEWYRKIGFDEIRFRGQFEQGGLPDCTGAFTGTCDSAIAEWIGRRLEKNDTRPDFVYWMTLNSHLPVLVPAPLAAPASCDGAAPLRAEPALCSWYQLIANVHRAVAGLALANLNRPTVFAVVGDHAPPFTDPQLRERFSAEEVPYLLLIPRQIGTGPSAKAEQGNASPRRAGAGRDSRSIGGGGR